MAQQLCFFEKQKSNSQIKSEIVSKYFWMWAQVMKKRTKTGRLAYIDLYSGQGVYEDGSKSTPILILEKSLLEPLIKNQLVSYFNDADPECIEKLKSAVKQIENINELKYKPVFSNFNVDNEIEKKFREYKFDPTLFFVDPFGYKGLSLGLIKSVLKDWGCDCFFFFNYVRVNAAINNDKLLCHTDGIFGKGKTLELRTSLSNLCAKERELKLIIALKEALYNIGGKYCCGIRFQKEDEDRTGHYLVSVSKNVLAYNFAKNLMQKYGTDVIKELGWFEYNSKPQMRELWYTEPIKELEEALQKNFKGQTRTVDHLFKCHNINKPYVESDYKQALKNLEKTKKITTEPSQDKRRKNTMGNEVKITFV
jgi:three-Cys-motif partner protein